MYQPAHFTETDPQALLALMREAPLATLVHGGADGPVADLLPLEVLPGAADGSGWVLRGHVARANPLWQAAAGRAVLALFAGPQAYVSPNWYPAKAEHHKVVPTWNYSLVQAHGVLRAIPDADWLHALVSRLTDHHEAGRGERPWQFADAPADYRAAMLRNIVGIEIAVTRLEGKAKLSQNRAEADRLGVIAGLRADAAAGRQPQAAAVAEAMARNEAARAAAGGAVSAAPAPPSPAA